MIEIRKLTKTYRLGSISVNALVDVSFDVLDGQMVCIVGRSSSGKSTLLHQLGLIDRPTSGQIFIDGQDITDLSDRARSHLRLTHIGYVFQEYALINELTAYENVYLPGIMLGHRDVEYRRRARELMKVVGLESRLKHRPKELSGGEQQRVAIARALINQPRILLADEPCANLDTATSTEIMDILVRLNNEMNLTVVFVSHIADDKKYASKCLMLGDGRIL